MLTSTSHPVRHWFTLPRLRSSSAESTCVGSEGTCRAPMRSGSVACWPSSRQIRFVMLFALPGTRLIRSTLTPSLSRRELQSLSNCNPVRGARPDQNGVAVFASAAPQTNSGFPDRRESFSPSTKRLIGIALSVRRQQVSLDKNVVTVGTDNSPGTALALLNNLSKVLAKPRLV